MKLNVTKEVKTNGRGGVVGGEYSRDHKRIGRLSVVDAIPAHEPRCLVAHGVAALEASDVHIVVVWWPTITTTHH